MRLPSVNLPRTNPKALSRNKWPYLDSGSSHKRHKPRVQLLPGRAQARLVPPGANQIRACISQVQYKLGGALGIWGAKSNEASAGRHLQLHKAVQLERMMWSCHRSGILALKVLFFCASQQRSLRCGPCQSQRRHDPTGLSWLSGRIAILPLHA